MIVYGCPGNDVIKGRRHIGYLRIKKEDKLKTCLKCSRVCEPREYELTDDTKMIMIDVKDPRYRMGLITIIDGIYHNYSSELLNLPKTEVLK